MQHIYTPAEIRVAIDTARWYGVQVGTRMTASDEERRVCPLAAAYLTYHAGHDWRAEEDSLIAAVLPIWDTIDQAFADGFIDALDDNDYVPGLCYGEEPYREFRYALGWSVAQEVADHVRA